MTKRTTCKRIILRSSSRHRQLAAIPLAVQNEVVVINNGYMCSPCSGLPTYNEQHRQATRPLTHCKQSVPHLQSSYSLHPKQRHDQKPFNQLPLAGMLRKFPGHRVLAFKKWPGAGLVTGGYRLEILISTPLSVLS